jgi:hypothetical protein
VQTKLGKGAVTSHTCPSNGDASELKPEEFLKYLDKQGVDKAVLLYCGGLQAARGLYHDFMHGPNFDGWMKRIMSSSEAQVPASAPS